MSEVAWITGLTVSAWLVSLYFTILTWCISSKTCWIAAGRPEPKPRLADLADRLWNPRWLR